jgi:iron-sulfur cluster repair protein YtfE (RIC family)
MPTRLQSLRDEHREMLTRLESLRTAADSVGEVPLAVLQSRVARAVEFLTGELLPHADAEERGLYPVVARLMGAPEGTQTMAEDHLEAARLTVELDVLQSELRGPSLAPPVAQELRRILYGLYALITAHLAKEEKVFFPILEERLTRMEAARMFRAMEEFAREAHAVHAVMQQVG